MMATIPIVVLFVWLTLIWLSLLAVARRLRRIGLALESQVITLVLMLRQKESTEELLEMLDDLKKEVEDADSKDSG